VIVAHVSGIPLEETVVQLAPAAAAILGYACVAARVMLRRWRPRHRRPVIDGGGTPRVPPP
jgi:hypothetical protein